MGTTIQAQTTYTVPDPADTDLVTRVPIQPYKFATGDDGTPPTIALGAVEEGYTYAYTLIFQAIEDDSVSGASYAIATLFASRAPGVSTIAAGALQWAVQTFGGDWSAFDLGEAVVTDTSVTCTPTGLAQDTSVTNYRITGWRVELPCPAHPAGG